MPMNCVLCALALFLCLIVLSFVSLCGSNDVCASFMPITPEETYEGLRLSSQLQSYTFASLLRLDQVDEVPKTPCNRATIKIYFRALICKIASFSSSLQSGMFCYLFQEAALRVMFLIADYDCNFSGKLLPLCFSI